MFNCRQVGGLLIMAVGKNKRLAKGKKGGKKKIIDPFTKKDWYDVKAPSMFNCRQVGKTLVSRTVGTKIASDGLKGRVFECNQADLHQDERQFEQLPPPMVEVETVRVGGPKVGGAYCTLCEVVVTSLDSSIQDKTNEAQIKQALDVLCYGLSSPVHKECIKLIDQYTDELVDMIVKEYPPNVICNELGLCVDHEIDSNAIPPVSFETIKVATPLDNSVSC